MKRLVFRSLAGGDGCLYVRKAKGVLWGQIEICYPGLREFFLVPQGAKDIELVFYKEPGENRLEFVVTDFGFGGLGFKIWDPRRRLFQRPMGWEEANLISRLVGLGTWYVKCRYTP